MPTGRYGNKYYTEEQYKKARYESSALEYARARGYNLEQQGNVYTMKEHDSMVFTKEGMWFWNSRNLHGGAIEFITMFEQRSYVDAVLILAGERQMTQATSYAPKAPQQEEKKEFVLPKANEDCRRVFAYLSKQRGIDFDIVKQAVRQKVLYESAPYHNAIFVSRDDNGKAVGAFQRGTMSTAEKAFKRDVAGSKKSPFMFKGQEGARTLKVFEASIDCLSEASMCKLNGEAFDNCDRIALGGLNLNAFEKWLEAHQGQYDKLEICFDNDIDGTTTQWINGVQTTAPCNHGQEAAAKVKEQYGNTYDVVIKTPHNKDFNEDLIAMRQGTLQAVQTANAVNEPQAVIETSEGDLEI